MGSRAARLYSMERRISVVITRQRASGLMDTSPVMMPTSPNSSPSSRNFWLLSACREQQRFSDAQ